MHRLAAVVLLVAAPPDGRTKAGIGADLVAGSGPAVLAVTEDDGVSIAARLVPALLPAGGIGGVALAARRRRAQPAAGGPAAAGLDPEGERRPDREPAAFDR